MRKYLSTLHKRSDRHKKNFALLVSGGATLLMFGVWFVVRYGGEPVVAQNSGARELVVIHEVGPLESLTASVGASWQELTEKFGSLFDSLGTVNFDQGYEDMKTKTLDQYGR